MQDNKPAADEARREAQRESVKAQVEGDVNAEIAARDELITLLARSDPASADRLSEVYVKYRAALGQPPR